MSRCITFIVLAASATLIATQASADRECFEDSCRLPDTAEASSMQPSAADESPAPEASAAVPKPAPAKALPQVVAEPVARAPLPTTPSVVEQVSAPREPVRLAPRYVKEVPGPDVKEMPAPPPVRAADMAAGDDARAERVAAPVVTYRAYRSPAPVRAAAVAAPGAIYAEDDVVRVYPNPRHDPAWKLCQLDSRERDQRRCGAYSYHPFGENGYRPYGTYAAERAAPVYLVAPNAKIISIDSDD